MHKQSKARQRLAQHMEDRRVALNLRWADVAEAAGMSAQGIRQVRFENRPIRPLTAGALEEAPQWEPGSIRAVLGGGSPTPKDAAPAALAVDVLTAIERDPDLVAEAKEHLRNQYALLLRVQPSLSGGAGKTPTQERRQLRAVAQRYSTTEQKVAEDAARRARQTHEAERDDGDGGKRGGR